MENPPLCLVDEDENRRAELRNELVHAGRADLVECNSNDFAGHVIDGNKYTAVLIAAAPNQQWSFILKLCDAAGIPFIILLGANQWEFFLPPSPRRVGFDVVSDPTANCKELLWRLDSLLARNPQGRDFDALHDYSWGDYRFIGARTMVLHKGREIPLQRRQFIFALKMFQSFGAVVTRDYLARCFGERLELGSRSLDVCAATIRKKLELREENGLILRAVYRHGYQLVSLGTSHSAGVYA